MKKNKTNLKNLLLTTALVCAPLTSFAQTPTKPADMDSLISAQIGVSKDNVQKFFRDLVSGDGNVNFNNADFKRKALKLSNDADTAMQVFESEMKNKVFAGVKIYTDNYNSVYNSKSYASEEKAALLAQLFTLATTSLDNTLNLYQQEITKLIEVTGIHPLVETVTTVGRANDSDEKTDTYHISELDTLNEISVKEDERYYETPMVTWHEELSKNNFESNAILKFIVPQISNGCYSSSCITLSLVMFTKYIKLLEVSFLNDMTIELADGKTLTISASTLKKDTTTHDLEFLGQTTLSPEMDNLPFDISDSQLDKVIADEKKASEAAERKKIIASITNDLNSQSCTDSNIQQISTELAVLKQTSVISSTEITQVLSQVPARKAQKCFDRILKQTGSN